MFSISRALVALAVLGAARGQPHSSSCTSTTAAQPAATADPNAQLFTDLFSAPTAIKRFQRLLVQGGSLLTGEALRKLIVFDFNGAQPANGALGGAIKSATIETFPLVTDLDISMTLAFLEPCGINTPHIHPRATEFLVLVEGSDLRFGSFLENGLVSPGQNQEVAGTLDRYQATAFSSGSIHYQFNNGCQKAVFVAAFNSANPGTSSAAQGFFSLNAEVVNATLGPAASVAGGSLEELRGLIPESLAQDVRSCLARCQL
ncbi:uncharacterized protein ALTATR162_LOCUS12 [Alternaria atra]|uniref:Cupin type-1 domain-containing protein n=1 Tax=Alternaria atra TaxID=119953 RepID=A0A8J2MU72_9PLEO|nr:uncharacterized protein ALTATR162_LOCUS12 [Alternaria atra]CAG5136918.1 unnamed protein product [Alternaria atra]